jgi:hypothetical protein
LTRIGRPPLGDRAMTPTERKRLQRLRQRSVPAPSRPSAPSEHPEPEHSLPHALTADLTRRRDQALRERDEARQALHSALQKPVVVDGHREVCRCWICKKRREEVEVMIHASRIYFDLFICSDCVEECNKIIAARRQRLAAGGPEDR